MSLLVRYLRRHWPVMAAGVAVLLVCSGMQLYTPMVIRGIFNDLQASLAGADAGRVTKASFLPPFLLLAALTMLVALTRMSWRIIIWPTSRRIEYGIRRDLFAHMQRLPPDFFHASTTGDLMSRATSDVETLRRFFSMGLVCFADALLLMPGALILMGRMDWRLTLAAAAPLLLGVPLSRLLMIRLHSSYRASQDTLGELTARVQEDIGGARIIKTFVREAAALGNFDRINADYTAKAVRVSWLDALFEPYFRIIPHVSAVVILAWGGHLVLAGRMKLGDLTAFMLYVELMIWPTFATGMALNMLQRARASAKRLEEIFSSPPAERAPEESGPAGFEGRLSFRNLSYVHRGKDEPAVAGLTLEVPAGTLLGITGPTGSGKSTLLGLAAGLLTPPRGTVLLDGADIREVGPGKLRRAVSLVEQTPFLFSRSLAENLAYGRAEPCLERVEEAVRMAALESDVARFEQGLSTIVGERGVTLSGGQRLRSALARALVMEPRVLLLDDVFSAVDMGTERAIWTNIRGRLKGTTVVVVSHRTSVLRGCDRIAVIEGGRLSESGTHEELLASGGFYARTFGLQERFET
jgi:ATP-binding cassette subfamily B multidrug efflux pump